MANCKELGLGGLVGLVGPAGLRLDSSISRSVRELSDGK